MNRKGFKLFIVLFVMGEGLSFDSRINIGYRFGCIILVKLDFDFLFSNNLVVIFSLLNIKECNDGYLNDNERLN